MPKCPNCKKDVSKSQKSWIYGPFEVKVYSCPCGTVFREYIRNGKHVFTLKREKGRFKKA